MTIVFSSVTAMTVTNLNSLASSATVGWQSAVVDNTSTLYDDVLVQVVVDMANTVPGSSKALTLYAYSGLETAYTNPASGSESTITVVDITTTPQNFRRVGHIPYTTQDEIIESSVFSLKRTFGGVMPIKWGLVLLDHSGAAISATGNTVKWLGVYRNTANPSGIATAITVDPVTQSLNTVVNAASAGDVIELLPGIHRGAFCTPKTGMTIRAQAGAVMNGSVVLSAWTPTGGRWFATATPGTGSTGGTCIVTTPPTICGGPEDLFSDGVQQVLVGDLASVTLGSNKWWFDKPAQRVYVGTDPTTHLMELSRVATAIIGSAASVTLQNLVIEKYAPGAQLGAVQLTGTDWIVTNCEVRYCHGYGLRTWTRLNLTGGRYHHNGQMGVAGQGTDVTIADCEIDHNNTVGYSPDWEAGGTKWAFTTRLTVRNVNAHHNVGPGLWTDIDNINTLYENCNSHDNSQAGIMHEISYAAIIRNNTCTNNGTHVGIPGAAYTQMYESCSGIFISSSTDCEVYNNTLSGNTISIGVAMSPRGSGAFGLHEIKNLYVHDNDVTQVGGFVAGLQQNVGDTAYFPNPPASGKNIVYQNNHYHTSGGAVWVWNNGTRSFAYWQATALQDTTGTGP